MADATKATEKENARQDEADGYEGVEVLVTVAGQERGSSRKCIADQAETHLVQRVHGIVISKKRIAQQPLIGIALPGNENLAPAHAIVPLHVVSRLQIKPMLVEKAAHLYLDHWERTFL